MVKNYFANYLDKPLENKKRLIRPFPNPAATYKNVRDTTTTTPIDTNTPSPNVTANPLISVVPRKNNTAAEMRLEIFPSRIAFQARSNPR